VPRTCDCRMSVLDEKVYPRTHGELRVRDLRGTVIRGAATFREAWSRPSEYLRACHPPRPLQTRARPNAPNYLLLIADGYKPTAIIIASLSPPAPAPSPSPAASRRPYSTGPPPCIHSPNTPPDPS